MFQSPSRFIAEIPAELIEEVRSRAARISPSTYAPTAARAAPRPSAAPAPQRPPQRTAQEAPGGLRLGQRVTHAKFGEGVILNYEGQGSHARVQVNFKSVGSKWLVVAYAKLDAI